MADWHSQLNELFHRWLDWNGIEAPVGYIDSGVDPEWTALMERYLKEEGDYTAEQEAFILGFWGREVGLDPKWVGNEVKMIKWMLNIR